MTEPLYRSRPGGFDILPASRPEALRVAESIYLSPGLSNSYLVVTPEGRVVINTGMGFEAAVHRRNYDAVDRGPVRYIVLTQGHVDHVGGVDALRDPDTEIVAHRNNAWQQDDDARLRRFRASRSAFAFADAIAEAQRHFHAHPEAGIPAQSRPEPTITFDDSFAFELGGRRFELHATPGGETPDSLVVWLPDERICFTGNLFSALFGHFPNLVTIRGDHYRDALAFVSSLDRVLALGPERLLVGHHGPVDGADTIRSELLRLRGAVQYVHDETVKGMNAGADVFTLMREIALPPELEVGQGYGKVAWSVRAIWERYAGWFHHRSTTELYAAPPDHAHPALLALAGGAGPVVAAARAHLEGGDPLTALHLCDVVLGSHPDDRGALAVSIDAHAALAERSENFWETSWLRREIERMKASPGGS